MTFSAVLTCCEKTGFARDCRKTKKKLKNIFKFSIIKTSPYALLKYRHGVSNHIVHTNVMCVFKKNASINLTETTNLLSYSCIISRKLCIIVSSSRLNYSKIK